MMLNKLTNPPDNSRARELWLQNAAGFILFDAVRKYAIDKIAVGTGDNTKADIINGIDNAVYGLMMMDGVTGNLTNKEYILTVEHIITLKKNGSIIEQLNMFDRDGMCMGYHGCIEGDFGEDEICPVTPYIAVI